MFEIDWLETQQAEDVMISLKCTSHNYHSIIGVSSVSCCCSPSYHAFVRRVTQGSVYLVYQASYHCSSHWIQKERMSHPSHIGAALMCSHRRPETICTQSFFCGSSCSLSNEFTTGVQSSPGFSAYEFRKLYPMTPSYPAFPKTAAMKLLLLPNFWAFSAFLSMADFSAGSAGIRIP